MTSARKIKLSVSPPKPRNPVVRQLARAGTAGKAGAHRKAQKALRAAEKAALKKTWNDFQG